LNISRFTRQLWGNPDCRGTGFIRKQDLIKSIDIKCRGTLLNIAIPSKKVRLTQSIYKGFLILAGITGQQAAFNIES